MTGALDLRRGLKLRVAPLFASREEWNKRLRINSGVEMSVHGVHARPDWRPLDAAELALLVGDAADAAGDANRQIVTTSPNHHVEAWIVSIPSRLQALWWTLAEQTEHFDGHLDGFETFIVQLEELFRFKRLPLPNRCRSSVVASRPGLCSTRVDAAGSSIGLGFAGGAAANAGERLLCTINLGAEATEVVLLNLSLDDVRQSLLAAPRAEPVSSSPDTLLAHFWAVRPNYPLVQLRLDPGEGLWLPAAGLVYDGHTQGKREPDIVLNLWLDPDQPAPSK